MTEWKILDNPIIWELSRSSLDFFFSLYRKRIDKMKDWGVLEKSISIIDIGCGIGQYCKITEGIYLGIDLQPKYIEYCNKKYKNTHRSFRCADAASIVAEKSKFELVLMVDFLHHLPDYAVVKILKDAEILSSKYIVSFEPILEQVNPIGKWFIEHDRGDHMRSKESLINLFKTANLKITDSSDIMLGPIKTTATLIRKNHSNS